MRNLEKTYAPKQFEERIYKEWKDSGSFHAEVDSTKKPFTISMPPPNVTGSLHLGHALGSTIQDILIRYKRMKGFSALWLPGTDHASISTEAKVVEKIRNEGKTKEELGREGFLKEAWDWTYKYGDRIEHQLEKLGVSCDWDRKRFTLDEGLSRAVEEQFIRLYEDGYIYRGDRIINYCIDCGTAVSDAEVEHEDEHGHLWKILYPYADGSEGGIEIETTRPETMLGDLAIAVHPEDERYKDMVGKTVTLPLVGREIPIIADDYVDPTFGSGAVKITPSHDPNDFLVGERHDLGQMIILNNDGTIADGYAYSGLSREEARKTIVSDLKEQGYLVEVKDHDHAVGHCERCGTVIEPLISKQWFVAMEELAKEAIRVYEEGEMRIIPDRFGKVYLGWLENIRDWCISRQLWWGHRLPVYYCEECGETIVSREEITTCQKCSGTVRRDEDTLDTWFSSALWTFSTLGWPEKTPELDYFHPTDVLVTGYDIIFFWVIRMVFSSLYSMKEIPFYDVYLTGIVRDAQGRKMSKSLNNGIDPLEVIDNYGADALRFMLVTGNSPGNDMRFHMEKVEQARNFANKLWNASRFVFMYMEEDKDYFIDDENLKVEDRWILGLLEETRKEVDANFDKYEIGLAANKVYEFTWDAFCDWYIELVKPRLYEQGEEKDRAMGVLLHVLEEILAMLHPFMPFITEEIYAYLPGKDGFLMTRQYDAYRTVEGYDDAKKAMELVMNSITEIRTIRQEKAISPQRKSEIFISAKNADVEKMLLDNAHHLQKLAFGSAVESIDENDPRIESSIPLVLATHKIFLPMADLLDIEGEIARLEAEIKKLNGEVSRLEGKLKNEGFVSKAPAAVVEGEKEKLAMYKKQLEETHESLATMNGLKNA